MDIYKFVGYVQSNEKRRDGSFYEEMICGQFIQKENDEIIGKIEWDRGNEYPSQKGYSFIKGLFIDQTKLIFVEITEDKKEKGFCFYDINEIGYYDGESDWLGGLFCGDSIFWKAYASVEKEDDIEGFAEKLEVDFKQFCDGLDDWKMMLFKYVQDLRDFVEYKY